MLYNYCGANQIPNELKEDLMSLPRKQAFALDEGCTVIWPVMVCFWHVLLHLKEDIIKDFLALTASQSK